MGVADRVCWEEATYLCLFVLVHLYVTFPACALSAQ